MNIVVKNNSNSPIYEQISSQMKDAIVLGTLKQGELLPSIRSLAKDLRVSVITTKRAYEELERDGFIVSVPGKGSYVAEQSALMHKEAYLTQIEEHLEEVMKLSKIANVSKEELQTLWKLLGENYE